MTFLCILYLMVVNTALAFLKIFFIEEARTVPASSIIFEEKLGLPFALQLRIKKDSNTYRKGCITVLRNINSAIFSSQSPSGGSTDYHITFAEVSRACSTFLKTSSNSSELIQR